MGEEANVLRMREEHRETLRVAAGLLIEMRLKLTEELGDEREWLFTLWLRDHLDDWEILSEIFGGGLLAMHAAYMERLDGLDEELREIVREGE